MAALHIPLRSFLEKTSRDRKNQIIINDILYLQKMTEAWSTANNYRIIKITHDFSKVEFETFLPLEI